MQIHEVITGMTSNIVLILGATGSDRGKDHPARRREGVGTGKDEYPHAPLES